MYSKSQVEKLVEKMDIHKLKPGPLMPTLHDAQMIIGYIPFEIQKIISNNLKIPVAKINGVVSFYSQFSVIPKGKNVIGICTGTACYVKGAKTILNDIESTLKINQGETTNDYLFSLQETRCVGACSLAPVMMINENIHGKLNQSRANEIIVAIKENNND